MLLLVAVQLCVRFDFGLVLPVLTSAFLLVAPEADSRTSESYVQVTIRKLLLCLNCNGLESRVLEVT